MKPPKCRLCGNRHYGLCEFKGAEASGGTGRKSPEDIGRASEEKACETAAIEGPGNPKGLPDNQSSPDGVRPLTNAERQKLYRERKGEEYRKWNRERMRERRK